MVNGFSIQPFSGRDVSGNVSRRAILTPQTLSIDRLTYVNFYTARLAAKFADRSIAR